MPSVYRRTRRRDPKIALLEENLGKARDYETYFNAAAVLDEAEGRMAWRGRTGIIPNWMGGGWVVGAGCGGKSAWMQPAAAMVPATAPNID